MAWTGDDDLVCDNHPACETVPYLSRGSMEQTSESARSHDWHHGVGVTIGGTPYDVALCPACAKASRRTRSSKVQLPQEELPLWPEERRSHHATSGRTHEP